MSLEVVVSPDGPVQVAELNGRLDNLTAPVFEQKIAPIAATTGARIVLDLAGLDYVSSAGLRSVLGILKRLSAGGGRVVVASPQASVAEIFEISGFKSLITMYPDRAAAVAALG